MPTQCDTCTASICDDMTSSQTHCGYDRVLENLTHHQPVQKFPSVYETRRTVPRSQHPNTFPYREPDEPN